MRSPAYDGIHFPLRFPPPSLNLEMVTPLGPIKRMILSLDLADGSLFLL